MKSVKVRVIILLLLFSLLFSGCSYAAESNNEESNAYSKMFLEWLELPEEEKKDTIAPLPFTISRSTLKSDNTKNSLKAGTLPAKYDLRDTLSENGIELEVKNQMNTGECWAFSANSTLETNLALQNEVYNFSERHLEYNTAKTFKDGINPDALEREVGDGGYSSTAFTYYSRGSGPILEEDMPFENNESKILLRDLPQDVSVKKVDNMIYFPTIVKEIDEEDNITYTDGGDTEYTKAEVIEMRNKVKEHIMTYGAVTTSIYATNTGNPFFNNTYASSNVTSTGFSPNHAVTIIGWDDNFSKTKFAARPHENGAYIVLNSWDTTFGKQGVYYISYEDVWVEYQLRGVTEISDVNYDKIYQHDNQELFYTTDEQYIANVYTAEYNELLTEVMIGTWDNQTCNVYINNNGDNLNINNLTLAAGNVSLKPGYNTIKLANPVELTEGHKFAVVVAITSYESHKGIAAEGYYADGGHIYCNPESHENESFSSNDGITWEDVYDESFKMNYSIKAFTQRSNRYVNIAMNKYEVQFEDNNSVQKVTLKYRVSRDLDNKELNVNIYNSNNTNVNSYFTINNSAVNYRLGKTIITTKNNVEPGDYNVEFDYEGEALLTYVFTVRSIDNFDTNVYVKLRINDEVLYEALKDSLSTDDLFIYSDNTKDIIVRKDIKALDLSNTDEYGTPIGYGIESIEGLENFTQLEYLNLMGNPIHSLQPLANLEHIKYFYAHGYNFLLEEMYGIEEDAELLLGSDLIKNWSGLKELSVENCGIDDFSFLDNSRDLVYLNLANNNITNASFMNNLTKLRTLILDENEISDYSFLANYNSVENLSLCDCGIVELNSIGNYISNYTTLKNVAINWNDITYVPENFVDSLLNSQKLENVELRGNSIEDARMFNKFKDKGVTLDLCDQVFKININFRKTNIINLPIIYQQQNDENDIFYTTPAFGYTEIPEIYGCEWVEEKKSVRLTETPYYYTQTSYTPAGGGMSYIHDHHEIVFARIGKTKANLMGATLRLNIAQSELDPHIYVETSPTKVNYVEGESFDSSGLEIGYMDQDGYKAISSFTVENGDSLQAGQTSVTIKATYNNKTYRVEQPVSVDELVVIDFEDDNFGRFLYETIGGNAEINYNQKRITVNKSDIEGITELVVGRDYEVGNIKGVNQFTNLESLTIEGVSNYVDGVEYLTYLNNLKTLVLDKIKFRDYSIINTISGLQTLSFYEIDPNLPILDNPSLENINLIKSSSSSSEPQYIAMSNLIQNLYTNELIDKNDIKATLYLPLKDSLALDFDNGKNMGIGIYGSTGRLIAGSIYRFRSNDDIYEEYANRQIDVILIKNINGINYNIKYSYNYVVESTVLQFEDVRFGRLLLRKCYSIGVLDEDEKTLTTHKSFVRYITDFVIDEHDDVRDITGIRQLINLKELSITGGRDYRLIEGLDEICLLNRLENLMLERIDNEESQISYIIGYLRNLKQLQLIDMDVILTDFYNNSKLNTVIQSNSYDFYEEPEKIYLNDSLQELYKNGVIQKNEIQASLILPLITPLGLGDIEGIEMQVEEDENLKLFVNPKHDLTEEEKNIYEEYGSRQIQIKLEKEIDSIVRNYNYYYNYNVIKPTITINFEDDYFGRKIFNLLDDESKTIDYQTKTIVALDSAVEAIEELTIYYSDFIHNIAGIDKLVNIKQLNLGGCSIENIEPIGLLNNLEELSIVDNHIPLTNLEFLCGLTKLKRIELINSDVGEVDYLYDKLSVQSLVIQESKDIENGVHKIILPSIFKKAYLEEGTTIESKIDISVNNVFERYDANIVEENNNLVIYLDEELSSNKPEGQRRIKVTIRGGKCLGTSYQYNYNVVDEEVIINFEDNAFGELLKDKLGEDAILNINQKTITTHQSTINSINSITINEEDGVQNITGIDDFTNLEAFWIRGNGNNLLGVDGLESLNNLHELGLVNVKVENANLLSEFENLTTVYLQDTNVNPLEAYNSNLRSLSCSNLEYLDNEPEKIILPDSLQTLYKNGKVQKNEIAATLILPLKSELGYYTDEADAVLEIQEDANGELYVIPHHELTEQEKVWFEEYGLRQLEICINKTIDGVNYFIKSNSYYTISNLKLDPIDVNDNKILILPIQDNSTSDLLTEEYFYNKDVVEVKDSDGNDLSQSDKIGTGSVVTVLDKDGKITETYIVSILGELDGNGIVDMYDILRLIELVMDENSNVTWTDVLKIAGNCYKESNEIETPDLQDILRLIEYYYDNVEW